MLLPNLPLNGYLPHCCGREHHHVVYEWNRLLYSAFQDDRGPNVLLLTYFDKYKHKAQQGPPVAFRFETDCGVVISFLCTENAPLDGHQENGAGDRIFGCVRCPSKSHPVAYYYFYIIPRMTCIRPKNIWVVEMICWCSLYNGEHELQFLKLFQPQLMCAYQLRLVLAHMGFLLGGQVESIPREPNQQSRGGKDQVND